MALVGPVEGLACLGAGTAFPARALSNADVLDLLGTHEDPARRAFAASGIAQSLGFSERAWAHVVGEPLDHAREETTLSLAAAAADRALRDARVAPSALQLVIVSTSTPHRMTGTVSAALGAALGADCACIDLRTGCAGGLFALATAALYIAAGVAPVLLVGTETFSKVIPPGHKMSMLSLGDGAGALVLGERSGARLEAAFMRTDGKLGKLVATDGPLPPTDAEIARGGYRLSGDADELQAALPGRYLEAIGAALGHAGIGQRNVKAYVPHQTSVPLITEVAARAGFDAAQTFINVSRHANVGAAGWLVAFAEARAERRIDTGSRVALAAVGGGMSWASALWVC